MDATTLPTLLLGGDPTGDPTETYAEWGRGAGLPVVPRAGRRPGAALPARRRRRVRRRRRCRPGARRRGMSASSGLGRDNATWCHPAGALAAGGWDCVVDDSTPGWTHTGLRTATLTPGGSVEPGSATTRRWCCLSTAASSSTWAHPTGRRMSPSRSTGGPASSPARRTSSTPRPARPCGCAHAPTCPRGMPCGSRCAWRTRRRHRHPRAVPARRRGSRRAARCRNRVAPGAQLRRARRARRTPDDRLRGRHAGRQLESWPPHKHDTDRPGVEAELEEIYWFETQSTDEPRHRPGRLPAGLRHHRAADRRGR